MGKKLPTTPRSRVRSALRKLWLSSRERSAALKREEYCCEVCSVKQSTAKGREQKDVNAGTFPAPIQVGIGRVGWLKSEVQERIKNRPRVELKAA